MTLYDLFESLRLLLRNFLHLSYRLVVFGEFVLARLEVVVVLLELGDLTLLGVYDFKLLGGFINMDLELVFCLGELGLELFGFLR